LSHIVVKAAKFSHISAEKL